MYFVRKSLWDFGSLKKIQKIKYSNAKILIFWFFALKVLYIFFLGQQISSTSCTKLYYLSHLNKTYKISLLKHLYTYLFHGDGHSGLLQTDHYEIFLSSWISI